VQQICRIGMDTSKHVFQLHGVNAAEAPVLRKKLSAGRTYGRKRSDQNAAKHLAGSGPSTYGSTPICRLAVEDQESGPSRLRWHYALAAWPSTRFAFRNGLAFISARLGSWICHRGRRAALADAFTRVELTEVLAYTSLDNLRSQAVMARLQFRRDPSRDFTADYDTIKGLARAGLGRAPHHRRHEQPLLKISGIADPCVAANLGHGKAQRLSPVRCSPMAAR